MTVKKVGGRRKIIKRPRLVVVKRKRKSGQRKKQKTHEKKNKDYLSVLCRTHPTVRKAILSHADESLVKAVNNCVKSTSKGKNIKKNSREAEEIISAAKSLHDQSRSKSWRGKRQLYANQIGGIFPLMLLPLIAQELADI